MVEIVIAEYFDIGAALGIIGTMFVVLYYSRKQAQGHDDKMSHYRSEKNTIKLLSNLNIIRDQI